jgi:glycosyltransferase involved in cell wall biosynthesis
MTTVLYVAHNHMSLRPGGLEAYAGELDKALRESREFETVFVSRSGPPHAKNVAHRSTRLARSSRDENLYYFHTDLGEFEVLLWDAHDKRLYTEDWHSVLTAVRPDIVHFHHHLMLGYHAIRHTRRTLPNAAIVYTLHDFQSICFHDGQMVKTGSYELCHAASPRRCHECFPNVPAPTFFVRERFIKWAFDAVDLFIAPSAHARERYMEWGIPPEKILHEDYGRFPATAVEDPPDAGRRRRVGFFGRITPYKGVDVLLEAMKILEGEDAGIRLSLWGTNLDMQSVDFQERIARLLEDTVASVRWAGPYQQTELPALMSSVDWVVVPSVWWETGPLVIHEALAHRRPVICSDIGAMVERIKHEVNGLHFRVRDPESLAATIRRAADSPGLWDQLRAGITDPRSMDEHLEVITTLYRALLERSHHTKAA